MKNYLKFPLPTGKEWFRLPERVQDIVKSIEEVSNRVTEVENLSSSIATYGTSIYSTNPSTSNFNTSNGIYLGDSAGNGTNDQKNVMIGYFTGASATGVYNSNFIGVNAGENATGAFKSVFIGHRAGNAATNANHSNFIGRYAGNSATNAYDSNFMGFNAGQGSSGNNVNAFGNNAGLANALSGQTIFSNSSMPSYANHAAAALAITVALGASANCTYLYHNQATNSIGAVRL